MKAQILLSISLSLFCFCFADSYAQNLLNSRRNSPFTYIYQLQESEARKIYKKNIWKVDSSFFHSLVDSVLTDSVHLLSLKPGHYLKVFAEENQQKFEIASFESFEVFVLNNQTDLAIQVYDLSGKLIPDAIVKVRGNRLTFDPKSQSYLDKKSNQKGFVKISYNGITAYYDLERKYNNSRLKRAYVKLAYRTPLKYIWSPILFTAKLPFDGVKSIVHRYPRGTISSLVWYYRRIAQKVSCLFDPIYCDENGNHFTEKHTGYLEFNQPKYRPGDTVKVKAFILNKKGRGIQKPLELQLWNGRKDILLATLEAYTPGGYTHEFVLHDSLELRLDKNYYLSLQAKEHQTYIEDYFRYEDYELSKISLSLRVDQQEQYRGKEFQVHLKGSDENDLNLLEGRVELLLSSLQVEKYLDSVVFVPDTLLLLKEDLLPQGETHISIPDSIFPAANLRYEIKARLLTSDNEGVSENEQIAYFHAQREFDFQMVQDSVAVSFLENGQPKATHTTITAEDHFGNATEIYDGQLPVHLKVNPFYASYSAQIDSLTQSFQVHEEEPLLTCYTRRSMDSVFIQVENPRKLPFSYHIYGRNQEISRGYTDTLTFREKAQTHKLYYISLRYLWGGKVKEQSYRIPYQDKQLQVKVNQPPLVVPGQKVSIEVQVLDAEGEAVEGVDVLAFGLTKKFDYEAPALPYLGKAQKSKRLINEFQFSDTYKNNSGHLPLDYQAWKSRMQLDTIPYYPFLYPGNELYRFEYETASGRTQFAPFVMSKGAIQAIHVIYVDDKPVYFSWSTHAQPYSFEVDSGYHRVKLRCLDREIILDSLYVNPGKKLILSLDADRYQPKVSKRKTEVSLSPSEQRSLYPYIFPYRYTFGPRFAYLSKGSELQLLLSSSQKYNNKYLAGPVTGALQLKQIDSSSVSFIHEPFFEYEFQPGLIKMRQMDPKKDYPKFLYGFAARSSLQDEPMSMGILKESWKKSLAKARYSAARYSNPSSTRNGYGKLLIDPYLGNEDHGQRPLNLLLFQYEDAEFLRVYPGTTTLFHGLPNASYQLISLYEDGYYQIHDSLEILPNGLNYYRLPAPDSLIKDDFSQKLHQLLESTIFKPSTFLGKERELFQIHQEYQQKFSYTGPSKEIEGYVYDDEDRPLPGATVIVKGTTIGAITDLDGYFRMNAPVYSDSLIIAYIGYTTEEISQKGKSFFSVRLIPSVLMLEEVVVTAYGTVRKSELTGTVATIESTGYFDDSFEADVAQILQGKATGVTISSSSAAPGASMNLAIRGLSTISQEQKPLYIIDGIVFTGDVSSLDPGLIQEMKVLSGESATQLYGARAIHGVVLITSKGNSFVDQLSTDKGAEFDEAFWEAAGGAKSLRENFSDHAFWQPRLRTDAEGKVRFRATFPDDITSWDTHFLAMNTHRQSGQMQATIKSYKPVMAQLALPRFLVAGDTAQAIGKALNYGVDSLEVTTKFTLNSDTLTRPNRWLKDALVDSLHLLATGDSLTATFMLEQKNGYQDGERRSIPVFPQGMEEAKGYFTVLDHDSSLSLRFDSTLGPVSLYARADALPILEDEISRVIQYRYFCNEQIASKLKALLAQVRIAGFRGEKFKSENEVDKMIRRLRRNQREEGLWGWWPGTQENIWISIHVWEALADAKQMGYKVDFLKEEAIRELLVLRLNSEMGTASKIELLRLLQTLGAQTNYAKYMQELEQEAKLSLNQKLKLMELKVNYFLPIDYDKLYSWIDTTLFGNLYIPHSSEKREIWANEIQNTLIAYRLLKKDSTTQVNTLHKMRNYFLEQRRLGYWANTYESMQIVETILPDMLKESGELRPPVLQLSGAIDTSFTKFPAQLQLNPGQSLNLSKSGSFPIYVSSYQHSWNPKPQLRKNEFEIRTYFKDADTTLTAAKPVSLIAVVEIKEDAEYLMINVPIPAGCSYANKKSGKWIEAHREYFRNETAIFCERLRPGTYTFEIDLMPRYSGTYTLNPAKVELMYFPTFFANTEIKKVRVE